MGDMDDTVFVYRKNNTIKVLDLKRAQDRNSRMIELGFDHILTLKASVWMENFINNTATDVAGAVEDLYEEFYT